MANKSVIMSLSVRPGMQDVLKTAAKKKGCSVSELFRVLIEKHLDDVVELDEIESTPQEIALPNLQELKRPVSRIVLEGDPDLPVTQEMYDFLEESAKKVGCTIIDLVKHSVEKHLSIVANSDSETPVLLKIPNSLRSDSSSLKAWLDKKSEAIVKAITKK